MRELLLLPSTHTNSHFNFLVLCFCKQHYHIWQGIVTPSTRKEFQFVIPCRKNISKLTLQDGPKGDNIHSWHGSMPRIFFVRVLNMTVRFSTLPQQLPLMFITVPRFFSLFLYFWSVFPCLSTKKKFLLLVLLLLQWFVFHIFQSVPTTQSKGPTFNEDLITVLNSLNALNVLGCYWNWIKFKGREKVSKCNVLGDEYIHLTK